jgi:hypothetical protein
VDCSTSGSTVRGDQAKSGQAHARAERVSEVLTVDEHVVVAVTWNRYQEIIAAHNEPVAWEAKLWMFKLIKRTRAGVSKGLQSWGDVAV